MFRTRYKVGVNRAISKIARNNLSDCGGRSSSTAQSWKLTLQQKVKKKCLKAEGAISFREALSRRLLRMWPSGAPRRSSGASLKLKRNTMRNGVARRKERLVQALTTKGKRWKYPSVRRWCMCQQVELCRLNLTQLINTTDSWRKWSMRTPLWFQSVTARAAEVV